ncbi:MAG: hypothetical protein LBN05_03670 [Oscillospiraceae bacterium]|nr:hypothetical protein [Oscillospiraceae bacterium]
MKKIARTPLEKVFWCVTAVLTPALVALRVYQLLYIIEPIDGFYSRRDWSVVLATVLLLAGGLLFVGVSFFKLKLMDNPPLRYDHSVQKNIPLALASYALALFLLVDILVCAIALRDQFAWLDVYMPELQRVNEDGGNDNLFTILMKTGLLPKLLEAVCALPAAAFLFLFGHGHWKGTHTASRFKFIALFPALWLVMRSIFRFTRTLSFLRVSELFYSLLALAFLMIFFITFAQLNSRLNDEDADWILPATGFPAVILSLVCFLPRVIVLLLGKENYLTELEPLQPVDAVLAVFVAIILATRIKKREEG